MTGRTPARRPTGGGSPPPGWPGSKLSVGEGDKLRVWRTESSEKGDKNLLKLLLKFRIAVMNIIRRELLC